MLDTPDFGSVAKWDGYTTVVNLHFTDGRFQGNFLNWGGFDMQSTLAFFNNSPYAGYTTNFAATENSFIVVASFVNSPYAGYTTNFAGIQLLENRSEEDVDIDSVIDHPKDQRIYYKLRGYNTSTQQYETWVIVENITGRPELFDPNRNPPNVENDVYKTAPSTNSLDNITIVGRWIQ